MTSTPARHLVDDGSAAEPSGLASQWADETPPRRAAAEVPVQYQSTPLRVDETFGAYEPYRAAPELQPFDAVAATPVLSAPRDGWGAEPIVALAPEPQPTTYGWTPAAAPRQMPVPTAPVPYPTAPVPYPTASSAAYGPNPYTAMAQPSQTSVGVTAAAVAIGGSAWALKHLVFAIPLIVGLLIFTVGCLSFGGRFGAVLVAFAWISAIPGIVRVVVKGPQSWARLRSRRY